MSLKTELLARVLDDEDLELKKSRFSKAEALFVGPREIAHFHSASEIDIRLTRAEIRKRNLRKPSDSRIEISSPSSDWVVVKFKKQSDLVLVQELLAAAARANVKE